MGMAPCFAHRSQDSVQDQGQRPAWVPGRGPGRPVGAALLPGGREARRPPHRPLSPGTPPTSAQIGGPTPRFPAYFLGVHDQRLPAGTEIASKNSVRRRTEAGPAETAPHDNSPPPALPPQPESAPRRRPRPVRAPPVRAPPSRRGCQGERAARGREGALRMRSAAGGAGLRVSGARP